MKQPADEGPEIAMCDCSSSNIARHGYDPDTKTLAVEFRGGGRWHYEDVPPATYEAFKKAKSMGTYFHNSIRSSFKGSAAGKPKKGRR